MHTASFQQYLDQLHERLLPEQGGAVASYIPELSRADPGHFGIALVTVDGHVYQSGDSLEAFSIQSISKAFVYGMALEDGGQQAVSRRIDVEPSGEAFNSISLEPGTGRPRNPMINAGAIVATSLVEGRSGEEKLARILAKFSAYTGREMTVDEDIYASERDTGHRNRAIAHLLRNYEILEGDPEQPLDAYFRQCSMRVNARDLALMGAALANGGVNPITGVRALQSRYVPRVLSVMATCGMYDYSGNWVFQVGMPAKSGVGGGIVAVLPGQFGVAVYSPPLDARGNSVRGIAVCRAFSEEFGTHMMRVTRTTTASVIRASYTAAGVRSKLSRGVDCTRRLDDEGRRILVMELAGELMFVSAEIVVSTALGQMGGRDSLVLDFSRVASIDQPAVTLLAEMAESLGEEGQKVFFSGTDRHFAFCQAIKSYFQGRPGLPELDFPDLDRALERAEDRLLGHAADESDRTVVPLEAQALCKGLEETEWVCLRDLLETEHYAAGEVICREGEPANRVYFLQRGRVSVRLQLDHRHDRRLAAFASGQAFGEAAFFERRKRSADIVADGAVEVLSLVPARLREVQDPVARSLQARLLSNLAALNMERLARANEEIRTLGL